MYIYIYNIIFIYITVIIIYIHIYIYRNRNSMTQSVFDFESHLMAGSLVCVFFSDRTKFPLNGCLGGQCNLGGGLRMGPKNGNSHQLS